MADLRLRINDLPEELTPAPIDSIAIDGPSTRRTTLQRAADAVRPYSTEAMAREGLNNASVMTPLRVSQAIETLGGQRFATAQQGNRADTAVQPSLTISAGAGLAGGGTLAANREIALNSASIASLALANSAVQPARQVIAGVGLTGGGSLASDRTVSLDTTTLGSLAKADSAVQPARAISAGTGLTGGGNLSADRTLALNAASVASLAKADSAVQPSRAINVGAGLSGGGDLSADRSLSLSAGTQASLARADSAIQAPGGTAGQILAKASSDPNDVDWVNIEGATAVSYGPQTLTGQQQGQARENIGVGPMAGYMDKLINGTFQVNIRGNSHDVLPGAVKYIADRWRIYNATNVTINVQRIIDSDIPLLGLGIQPRLRIQPLGVPTTGNVWLSQFIQGASTLPPGKVTLTLWNAFSEGITCSAGITQIFGDGGSPNISVPVQNFAGSVGAYGKFSTTFDIPATTGKVFGSNDRIEVVIGMPMRATNAVSVARISLIEGDVTLAKDPCTPRLLPIERLLCEEYCEYGRVYLDGYGTAGTVLTYMPSFHTKKRITPTITPVDFSYTNANSGQIVAIDENGIRARATLMGAGAGGFTATYLADAEYY